MQNLAQNVNFFQKFNQSLVKLMEFDFTDLQSVNEKH